MQAYIYRQHKHIAIWKVYNVFAKLNKIYHVQKVKEHCYR